jgi:hypothetical protein
LVGHQILSHNTLPWRDSARTAKSKPDPGRQAIIPNRQRNNENTLKRCPIRASDQLAVPAFAQEKEEVNPFPFRAIAAGPQLIQQLEAINLKFDEAFNKYTEYTEHIDCGNSARSWLLKDGEFSCDETPIYHPVGLCCLAALRNLRRHSLALVKI